MIINNVLITASYVYFINSNQLCCVQVLLLIDLQLAYVNTKHEDFIGFNK